MTTRMLPIAAPAAGSGDTLLGPSAAAQRLNAGGLAIPLSTVRHWMFSGRLPAVRVAGRFVVRASAVDRLRSELEQQPVAAGTVHRDGDDDGLFSDDPADRLLQLKAELHEYAVKLEAGVRRVGPRKNVEAPARTVHELLTRVIALGVAFESAWSRLHDAERHAVAEETFAAFKRRA